MDINRRSRQFLKHIIEDLPNHLAVEVRSNSNQMFVHDSQAERFYHVKWEDQSNFSIDGRPAFIATETPILVGDALAAILLSIRDQHFPWEMD